MAYTFKHGTRPLDDYTIQRAVGSGGFGEVYYAVSDGGREVALKYLRDNPEIELRGVGHCMNLKSPHLVSIFDIKKNNDGDYFIIMEYISGPSLRDILIAEPNGLGQQKAAFFVREIAKGLSYLHDRGIVHRDLKPGNIFYDDGYVKIGDYGLSKFIAVSRHSAQTASVGTVHYMAPEIGSGNYSRGVDIYALGVMLYEMLLGKVPFEGSSMAEVLMKHLTSQPEIDELPAPFGKVIRKALEKDPADRYQTVDEMVEDLLEVQDVRESLAGFSPQSLQGAVYRGSSEPAPSPNPSPNPYENLQQPRPQTPHRAGEQENLPPFAIPLPDRLARKQTAISRKIDSKLRKLERRDGVRRDKDDRNDPPPYIPSSDAEAMGGPPPPAGHQQRTIAPGEHVKRITLAIFTWACLSILAGFASGAIYGDEEEALGAGMAVALGSVGLFLSRKVLKWVSSETQPLWVERIVQFACCAPWVLIGLLPAQDGMSDNEWAGLVIGMLAVVLLNNWDGVFRQGAAGTISIWSAAWTGLFALISAAVASGIADGDPDDVIGLAFVAGTGLSLVAQVTGWWLPGVANRHGGGGRPTSGRSTDHPPAAPNGHGESMEMSHHSRTEQNFGAAADEYTERVDQDQHHTAYAKTAGETLTAQERMAKLDRLGEHNRDGRTRRWDITRMFWAFTTFVFFLLSCVVFVAPRAWARADYDTQFTLSIVAFGLFCVCMFCTTKMTVFRRAGFWRESFRPFLICASTFGIASSIFALASHTHENKPFIVLLCLSSVVFLLSLIFGGRKHRRARHVESFIISAKTPDAHAPTTEPQTEI